MNPDERLRKLESKIHHQSMVLGAMIGQLADTKAVLESLLELSIEEASRARGVAKADLERHIGQLTEQSRSRIHEQIRSDLGLKDESTGLAE
jgi:hypothetical protein